MAVRGLAREIASIGRGALKPVPALRASGKAAVPRVTIEDAGCRRYMARGVENVRIAGSPDWLRQRLGATGSRSINNVVDVPNDVLRTHGRRRRAVDASRRGGQAIV